MISRDKDLERTAQCAHVPQRANRLIGPLSMSNATRRGSPNEGLDALSGLRHVIVLPDDYERPPQLFEALSGIFVASTILREFCGPPITVRFRNRSVLSAPVPETASHLCHNFRFSEDDVMTSTPVQYSNVDAVSQPAPKELLS